jgi:hypothetical protein
MIILWKADYEGTDMKADLKKLDGIHSMITKELGGKVEGPFFPQDASLLYIFHVDKYEWLNKAGRIFFREVENSNLRVVPKSYEIAVTPSEFFGK